MIKEEPNVWRRSPRNCLSQNPVASAPLHPPKALLHSLKYSRRYPRSTDNRQQTLKYRCFLQQKALCSLHVPDISPPFRAMRSHHPSGYLHRVVRSAVIHKNDFQILPSLVQHGQQTPFYVLGNIINRNNNGNFHAFNHIFRISPHGLPQTLPTTQQASTD